MLNFETSDPDLYTKLGIGFGLGLGSAFGLEARGLGSGWIRGV